MNPAAVREDNKNGHCIHEVLERPITSEHVHTSSKQKRTHEDARTCRNRPEPDE